MKRNKTSDPVISTPVFLDQQGSCCVFGSSLDRIKFIFAEMWIVLQRNKEAWNVPYGQWWMGVMCSSRSNFV